jgi:Protein of unknown function (DUF3105)
MANKKKRKAPQRAGQRPPASVPVAPASPGGPNRIARKEEARRQREAIRRRMARRRTMRVVGAITAVAVVAAAITVYLVVFRQTAAEAAGCGPLTPTRNYDRKPSEDRVHIGSQGSKFQTPPPLRTYPSTPPVSGPHLPPGEWLPQGVYTTAPNPWSSIHSLEHGAVIVWLSPGAKGSDVTKLETFYRSSANNDHVIVAVYDYPSQGQAGHLPAGDQMALVFWHHVQYCQKPSFSVAQSFVEHYRIPTSGVPPLGYPRNGGAPEPGAAISPGSPPAFKP